MGLLDLFVHNKIKSPMVEKDVDMSSLEELNNLLDRVGDDQKEIVQNAITTTKIGLDGEQRVLYELKHLKEPCLILHDITLFDKAAEQAQMDFIVLTRKCGFVIESKSLSGNILINSEGEFTRQFVNKDGKVYKKQGIYSPIRQNEIHVDVLKDFMLSNKLFKNYPLESIVVIANGKSIINKTYASKAIKDSIVKYDQLDNKILQIMNKHDFDASDNKLLEFSYALKDNNVPRQIDYVASLKLQIVDEEIAEETAKAQESGFIEDEATAEKISDDSLINALKKYRLDKARELHYQPYYIFNNAQLEALIQTMPKTKEEFVSIEGLGDKKYELYGADILRIINGDSFVEEAKVVDAPVEKQGNSATTDDALEAALKKYRLEKARELNYKPYFIFNNEQMASLISKKPKNKEEFISLEGFGEKKYELYGEDILKIINK